MSPDCVSPSDAELVAETRQGRHEAFDTLVRRHFALVHGIALARLRDPEAADDLAQEVFLRAFLHLDELKRPPRFGHWTARIARNLAINWLRNRQRRSALVPQVPLTEASDPNAQGVREAMENREQENLLLQSLEHLPGKQREVVVLHFAEGMTKREIANRLGVHESTVGRDLKRALKRMRSVLENTLQTEGKSMGSRTAAVERAIAVVGSVGALSAASKSALAASATVGVLGGASAAGVLISMMGKAGAVSLTGKAAVVGAVIAIAAIGTAIIATKDNPPPPEPSVQVASVTVDEPESAPPEIVENASPEVMDEEQPAESEPEALSASSLSKFSRQWGRVTDTHGNPIAEALVYITGPELAASEPLLLTQTDFEGRFEFINACEEEAIVERIPSGSRTFSGRLVAEAPGYARATRIIRVRATEVECNLELVPAGSLAGEIVWDTGEPLANSEVVAITAVDESGFDIFAVRTLDMGITDAIGRFHLDRLAPGLVTLAARPAGERWIVAGDYEVGTEGIQATLRRPLGVVTGQLLGAFSREPIPNRVLSMGSGFPELIRIHGRETWVTQTDGDGRFSLDNVPVERLFNIYDAPTGDSLSSVTISANQTTLELTLFLPEATHVAGRVINNVTGEPVPGIRLELQPPDPWPDVQAVSDAEGSIDFGETGVESVMNNITQMQRHSVRLRLQEPGWLFTPDSNIMGASYQMSTSLSVDNLEDLSDLEIRMDPSEDITVRAVDPAGQPVRGAALTLACDSIERSANLRRTDSSGHLSVPLPLSVRQFQLYGSHDDWPMIVSPVFTHASREVVAQALPVTSAVVTVVDALGNPLPGMQVVPRDQTPILGQTMNSYSPPYDFPITNEEGLVTIENLPRSPHRFLTLTQEMGMPFQYPPTSLPQAEVDLTNAPDPAQVTIVQELATHWGAVRSGVTGEPVVGAEVRWVSDETPNHPVFTDANGEFEISGDADMLRDGVVVSAPGFATRSARYVPIRTDRSGRTAYTLYPAITLAGQVRRPDGSVPVASPLYLFTPVENPWGPEWDVVSFEQFGEDQWTREDGSFSWTPTTFQPDESTASQPAWLLVLTDEGETATADFWLDLTQPQTINLGDLTLLPGARLRALVLDADGQPMEHARVEWENMGEIDPILPDRRYLLGGRHPFSPSATWRAVTDGLGQCELVALPHGHWRFAVRMGGRRPEVFELDVAGDMDHTFTLPRDASMELVVRVTGFDGEPMHGVEVGMDRRFQLHLFETTDTNGEGIARFTDFPPGDWYITFVTDMGPEAAPRLFRWVTPLTVPPAGCEMDVNMAEWGVATGLVLQGGAPSPEARVSANQIRDDTTLNTIGRVHSDEQGVYRFPLPPGEYTLISDVGSRDIEIGLGEVIEVNLGN